MARFDIYIDKYNFGQLLLDVQSNLLMPTETRVVVPLLPKAQFTLFARRLNPVFTINGQDFVMVTQYLSAIRESSLLAPVSNLSERSDEITSALDMLFQGF